MNYQLLLASRSPRRRGILNMAGIEFTACNTDVDEATIAAKLSAQFGQACQSALARVLSGELAKQKALAAAYLTKEQLILAADTVVACRGRILGKPDNAATARAMLDLLTGAELSPEAAALLPPASSYQQDETALFPGQAHHVLTGVSLLIHEQLLPQIQDKLSSETLGELQRVQTAYEELNCYLQLNFTEKTTVYMHAVTADFEETVNAYLASTSPYDKAGAYAVQESIACLISGIAGDVYNVMGLPIHMLMNKAGRILPRKVVDTGATAAMSADKVTATDTLVHDVATTVTGTDVVAATHTAADKAVNTKMNGADLLDDFTMPDGTSAQISAQAPTRQEHAQLPKMPDFLKMYAKDKLDEQRQARKK